MLRAAPSGGDNDIKGRTVTVTRAAGDPLFASPPGCVFLHQAGFITGSGQFRSHRGGSDYNVFPFPDIDPRYAAALSGGGIPFASDSMPRAMNDAFCTGLVALTSGARSVDQVLADRDAVRTTAYTT